MLKNKNSKTVFYKKSVKNLLIYFLRNSRCKFYKTTKILLCSLFHSSKFQFDLSSRKTHFIQKPMSYGMIRDTFCIKISLSDLRKQLNVKRKKNILKELCIKFGSSRP